MVEYKDRLNRNTDLPGVDFLWFGRIWKWHHREG